MRAKSNVDDDDASAPIAPREHAAFHRAEGDRKIGRHRVVALAGGCIEAARHVECDNARAGVAQIADATNRVRNRPARRAGGAGAQKAIDHDAFRATRFARVDHRTRGLSLGPRVVGFRLGHFDDAHRYTNRRERRRDYPRITAVVSWTGEHRDAVRERVAERTHDFGGSRGSGALHERSRRDTSTDRSAIASGGLCGGDDVHGHATVVRQNDMGGGGW